TGTRHAASSMASCPAATRRRAHPTVSGPAGPISSGVTHEEAFSFHRTALSLMAGMACASAQAESLYAGGSVGAPHYPDTVNGISGSTSGIAGKLFGGYQVTPNFAVEAGAADLGHLDANNGVTHASSAFVDAVGIAPLNDKWSLLGRIGVAQVNVDTSAGDDSGSGLKMGLGAQYNLTSSVALRGEWERYRPHVFDGHPNLDQYTV